mmetsp:Transcript_35308/g.40086  ORF Transcript_35308/g.40086 Transcript_35308/m.40086 type:complete len:364 (+) Transcript_35308:24-1115(+)
MAASDDEIAVPILPKDEADRILHVRLSNIINVDVNRFDTDTFNINNFAEKVQKGEIGANIGNLIRWKYNKAGDVVSNARLVKWSDGTSQIYVGNEPFDVLEYDLKGTQMFTKVGDQPVYQHRAEILKKVSFKPVSHKSKSCLTLMQQFQKKNRNLKVKVTATNQASDEAQHEKLEDKKKRLLARVRGQTTMKKQKKETKFHAEGIVPSRKRKTKRKQKKKHKKRKLGDDEEEDVYTEDESDEADEDDFIDDDEDENENYDEEEDDGKAAGDSSDSDSKYPALNKKKGAMKYAEESSDDDAGPQQLSDDDDDDDDDDEDEDDEYDDEAAGTAGNKSQEASKGSTGGGYQPVKGRMVIDDDDDDD